MRGPLRLTPKGWLRFRYPSLLVPHAYIGWGPKGGGGCIDCGYARSHHWHIESATD